MLLNFFYKIKNQRTEENVILFDVILLPECNVYKGHFPDMPVAPGVFSIQMIKECVERITGKLLLLESMMQCKFLTMVTPEQHQLLQIRIAYTESEGNRLKTSVTIGRDKEDYVIFKGEFVPLQANYDA